MLSLLLILSQSVLTTIDPCCAQQGNICGDKCCDGTPFSPHCGTLQIISLPPTSLPPPPPTSQLPVEKKNPDSSTEKKNPSVPNKQNKKDGKSSTSKNWLYTWENPDTGAWVLSSTSPPWYKNSQYPSDRYPRVLVFDEYHRLIDDTDRPNTAEQAKTEEDKKTEPSPSNTAEQAKTKEDKKTEPFP